MTEANIRRIALLLEYDGARYAGSQLQANAPTVQAALEDAIERTTGARARVAFAGRTDAGVHARGQVASFDSATRLDPDVLRRALNAWLPPDVAVRAAVDATSGLDVRRHARSRHYRYLIDDGAVRPALDRGRVWHVAGPLDVEAMSCAARRLVGRHDFVAFAGALETPGTSTVRDVCSFEVWRPGGSRVVIDVVANAFLTHQVRRMTGALVEVGKGRRGVEAYAALLDGPPSSARPVAPPHGLSLIGVEYATPLFENHDRERTREGGALAGLDSRTLLC